MTSKAKVQRLKGCFDLWDYSIGRDTPPGSKKKPRSVDPVVLPLYGVPKAKIEGVLSSSWRWIRDNIVLSDRWLGWHGDC